DATDYDRQGVTLRWDRFMHSGATLKTVLSTSNIDQTTAGSSRLLKEDYENNPTANYTPISYREVQALRLSTSWEKETANSLLSITPYYRNNRMEYMPNWSFTYDPQISETENESLGLMLKYRYDIKPMRTRVITGMDIDYSPGSRLEKSIDATKVGNIYTSYVLKETIYDYDVSFTGVSPYVHVETSLSEKLRLTGGLRYDHIEYDYDNNLSDANIVLNPTSMTFPATYKHPSDTKVDFSHLSPKLGATYIFNKNLNGFASYRHSFRVPSEGQLFRPGKSNDTVSLEPVKIDSFEIGLRGKTANQFKYEVSLYHMTKDDDIITYVYADKSRESMNAGETLHRGIEIALGAPLNKRLDLDIAFSYAKHTYEDWNPEDGVDYSGNEMKSAPRLVANTRLNYRPAAFKGGKIELEWESLGSYWMNDANDYKYSGHDLFHLRGNYPLTKQVELYGRVMNITDERYATSAEYTSSGDFEYAPGMERTVYVGLNYKFK
ncbi:MAG: TonB-dependent receptor, partial [Gammaproteobacteria bacterium]|nr:TonB-dependent receptor [Gammaproteobacteria bacterium]